MVIFYKNSLPFQKLKQKLKIKDLGKMFRMPIFESNLNSIPEIKDEEK